MRWWGAGPVGWCAAGPPTRGGPAAGRSHLTLRTGMIVTAEMATAMTLMMNSA